MDGRVATDLSPAELAPRQSGAAMESVSTMLKYTLHIYYVAAEITMTGCLAVQCVIMNTPGDQISNVQWVNLT
jgi:hypothetical protein